MEATTAKTSKDTLEKIGQDLRHERLRQGLSCAEISSRLRIPERYIEAIETADQDQLPAMTYVIGYVRSYGNMMGLDAAGFCAALKESLSIQENKPDFNFVEHRLDQKANSGRTALAAMVAAVMIYGGWYAFSTGMFVAPNDPSNVETTVIALQDTATTGIIGQDQADQAPAADDTEIEPVFTEVAPRPAQITIPDSTINQNDQDQVVTANQNVVGQDIIGQDINRQTEQTAEESVLASNDQDDTSGLDAADDNAAEITPRITDAIATNRIPEQEITLKATANSWVEITRADGSAVSQRLMRTGETYVVPGGDDLFLTTGNAGGLEVRLGNDDPVLLGGWGEALRDLPLDQTIISQRY